MKGAILTLQIVTTTGILALGILTGLHLIGLLITILFIPIPIAIICLNGPRGIAKAARYVWNQPIVRTFGMIIVLTTTMSIIYYGHDHQISKELISPKEGKPWAEGLRAQVHWSKQPSQEMENGFADTVRLLGFTYENVHSIEEANLRIHLDSWKQLCKWPTTNGFAALEPNPGPRGSRTGDIYICKFTTPPPLAPHMTDRSLIAHETAHILAAQEHTDSGLMTNGPRGRSTWFNQDEIREMCDRINRFQKSVRAEDSQPGTPESRCG